MRQDDRSASVLVKRWGAEISKFEIRIPKSQFGWAEIPNSSFLIPNSNLGERIEYPVSKIEYRAGRPRLLRGEGRPELSQLALDRAHIFRAHAEKVPLGAGQRFELVVGPGIGDDQLLNLCGSFKHGHCQ